MRIPELLEFIHELENLKKETRHCWLSDGRHESVAEHSWRLSFMVIILAEKLDQEIDVLKALKLSVVHDLSEAYVGDMPSFLSERKDHALKEQEAMESLKSRYNNSTVDEIYNLWMEYENQSSIESKFIKALDKMEAAIQHNEGELSTWTEPEYDIILNGASPYCKYDNFLKDFNECVRLESLTKIESGK